MKILLLNPGLGNLGSIKSALDLLGFDFVTLKNYEPGINLSEYSSFILPGVGSFEYGIQQIKLRGLDKLINNLNIKNIRGLGICLGMQIFMESSTESTQSKALGLGLIKGNVNLLNSDDSWVPNVGWCETEFKKYLDKNYNQDIKKDFYYVHSYAAEPTYSENILCTTKHGEKNIVSGVCKDNLFGIQFHPEKSHDDGLGLINSILKSS